MERLRQITQEQLKKALSPIRRTLIWHGITVSVLTLLPLDDVPKFVRAVIDGCYSKTTQSFVPELKDFIFRMNVVSRYACVDLPTDLDELYTILYNTDLYDKLIEVINAGQLKALDEAVNTYIQKM